MTLDLPDSTRYSQPVSQYIGVAWAEPTPKTGPPAVVVVAQHQLGAIPNIEEHHRCQNHPSEHETDSKTHMAGAPCRP